MNFYLLNLSILLYWKNEMQDSSIIKIWKMKTHEFLKIIRWEFFKEKERKKKKMKKGKGSQYIAMAKSKIIFFSYRCSKMSLLVEYRCYCFSYNKGIEMWIDLNKMCGNFSQKLFSKVTWWSFLASGNHLMAYTCDSEITFKILVEWINETVKHTVKKKKLCLVPVCHPDL